MKFQGVYPSVLTPIDAAGQPMPGALRKMVRYIIDRGLDGLYVAGSTSEAFAMPTDMRRRILEIVMEEAAGKVPAIAHVGYVSTQETIDLARYAESLRYDAISLVPPYYYKFTSRDLRRHIQAVGESVGIPVILYNIPDATGVRIDTEVMREVLGYDFVAGLKHTSQDLFLLERLKTDYPDKSFFMGSDQALAAGLAMGADGGIGSTYTVLAPGIKGIYRGIKDGRVQDALTYQRAVNDVIEHLIEVGVFQGLKILLDDLGLEGGVCRAPFTMPSPEEAAPLRQTFRRHFSDDAAAVA